MCCRSWWLCFSASTCEGIEVNNGAQYWVYTLQLHQQELHSTSGHTAKSLYVHTCVCVCACTQSINVSLCLCQNQRVFFLKSPANRGWLLSIRTTADQKHFSHQRDRWADAEDSRPQRRIHPVTNEARSHSGELMRLTPSLCVCVCFVCICMRRYHGGIKTRWIPSL